MTAASLGLTDNQYKNARGIIAAVKARGWPIKAAYIAVETTLAESGMRILASANVPTSQQYPHDLIEWEPDGLGHDHASMGMYQQQTGYAWAPANQGVYQPNPTMEMSTMNSPDGWGTPAELMNAETSTAKFLDALAAQPWQSMTNWAAAQAVQRSAYADGSNYQAQDARAQQIVNALWSGVSPDSGNVTLLSEEDDDMLSRTIAKGDRDLLPVRGRKTLSFWFEDPNKDGGGGTVRAMIRNDHKPVRPAVTSGAAISEQDHFKFWLGVKRELRVDLEDGDWGVQVINYGTQQLEVWAEGQI